MATREQNNTGQVRYCLSKAITADPKDVGLRFDLASLYLKLGEYQKAAGIYGQVVGLYPANVVARKMAAKVFHQSGASFVHGSLSSCYEDRTSVVGATIQLAIDTFHLASDDDASKTFLNQSHSRQKQATNTLQKRRGARLFFHLFKCK